MIAAIIKCDSSEGRKGRIYFLLAFKSRFAVYESFGASCIAPTLNIHDIHFSIRASVSHAMPLKVMKLSIMVIRDKLCKLPKLYMLHEHSHLMEAGQRNMQHFMQLCFVYMASVM